MARGRQLSQLLNQLQGEAGLSTLPSSSVSSRDHRVQILNRVQARLYAAYDWDFTFSKRDVATEPGVRYVTQPADLDFERTNYCAFTEYGTNNWRELAYGINEAHYRTTAEGAGGCPLRWTCALVPSDTPVAPTIGYAPPAPAARSTYYANLKESVELWPVPDAIYTVRFRGVLVLPLMVDSDDRAVLDDTLIVLFAASELMKRAKLPDWEDKLREAQLHFTRLRAHVGGNKRAPFVSGGGTSGLIGDYSPIPRPGIDYIPN